MIIKLNAELDSVETAELAARMIKQRTDGILSIKIHSQNYQNNHEDSNFVSGVFPFFAPSSFADQSSGSSYLGGFVNLRDDYPDYDSREVSHSAIIDVICEKEAEKTVLQVFTSLGGLKINKN